jgi:phosphate transport system substrate-binding protein
MMLKKIFATLLFLPLLFAGCSRVQEEPALTTQTTPPEVSVVGLNIDNYPRVDGSTSTRPLQQMLACHILDIYCDWQEMSLFFSETRNILPPLDSDDPEETRLFLYNLAHTGTHDSYMNLIEGYADVILVAREPSEDEIREANKKGVKLDYRPVAQDAFVFLANVKNPIENIDVSQIRDIYTGKITTWDQLGVDLEFEGDGTISPYRRNPNSGSQELMESLVMQDEEMIEAPDLVLPTMIGPFNMIDDDVLGFGYSVYYYAVYMLPTETVRLVPVEGVLPTTDTIADGSYPFVTRVYVVIREDTSQESTAVQLRNWLLTPAGQAVVAQSGYVPFTAAQDSNVP